MVVDLAVAPTGAGPTEEHVWCRIQTGEYVAANVMDSPIARPGACFYCTPQPGAWRGAQGGVVHAVEDALYIIVQKRHTHVLLRASHDCSAMHTLGRASVAQGIVRDVARGEIDTRDDPYDLRCADTIRPCMPYTALATCRRRAAAPPRRAAAASWSWQRRGRCLGILECLGDCLCLGSRGAGLSSDGLHAELSADNDSSRWARNGHLACGICHFSSGTQASLDPVLAVGGALAGGGSHVPARPMRPSRCIGVTSEHRG